MKIERYALLALAITTLALVLASSATASTPAGDDVQTVESKEQELAASPACEAARQALSGAEAQWSDWAEVPRPLARYAEQSLYLDYSFAEVEAISERFLAVAVFECPELALEAQYQGGLALDRFADELEAMASPTDLGDDPEVHAMLADERRVFEVRVRVSAAERWLEGLAYALEHGIEGEQVVFMERRVGEIWDEWEGLQASN